MSLHLMHVSLAFHFAQLIVLGVYFSAACMIKVPLICSVCPQWLELDQSLVKVSWLGRDEGLVSVFWWVGDLVSLKGSEHPVACFGVS